MRQKDFIDVYAKSLLQGTGGLFIGAGLSMRANYPSWRELLRDMADEIGLDVDQETDLAGLVQYYLNSAGRTRTRLVRMVTEHFGEEKPIPPIFRSLARLPVKHIWTTNYDTLPERAWREQRKRLDVKSRDKDVTRENPWCHATLYKMHGTVDHPSEVVIAKSDYESYRRTRPGFFHLLTGQLISRNILFVGISFNDPNLNHLFAIIRESFDDTPPEHFAIVRRPKKADRNTNEQFEYAKRRHTLWVDDLQNYGIQCVEVDEYKEVDALIEAVERRIGMSSIMVSGSFPENGDAKARRQIETIAQEIGRLIARRQLRFVSGFGLVVGSAALAGMLDELNKQETPNFEWSLNLRPFPQLVPDGWKPEDYYQRYREDLVRQAGACIFVSGAKEDGSPADGVMKEFDIALAAQRYPIPIGVTGGAATEIWVRVASDYDVIFGKMPRRLFQPLNDAALSAKELLAALDDLLDWLNKNDPHA
jgi:hypothetical protein